MTTFSYDIYIYHYIPGLYKQRMAINYRTPAQITKPGFKKNTLQLF